MTKEGHTNGISRAYWMPFTANREFRRNPRMIARAEGCHYFDTDGRRLVDGLSGLWCVGAGHARPEIADAVSRQVRALDYAPAFQFGHPLAFELADRVAALTPASLDHVFFTCSGSDAVDTALKMALAYWRLRGQPGKTRLVGRAKGYHGVNIGGLSVGGIGANRKLFGPLLPTDHLRFPLLAENAYARGLPIHGADLADELDELAATHDPSTIAAVIVEPFAGSAGVIPPPRGYLERLRAACDRHDILLIFDEVISGFGRTGAMFGAEYFGVSPDIMTVAKALTNGVVPMGAAIASSAIHETFMEAGGLAHAIEFPHGYTYSGHPVACAAALAALDIFDREKLTERATLLAPYFEEAVHALRGASIVTDIRNIGLAAALQLDPVEGQPGRRAYDVAMRCWEAGAYVRYSGETIQLAPPLISGRAEVDQLVGILGDALAGA